MKKKRANPVRYTVDLANLPALTLRQKTELAALEKLGDREINYSDIPQGSGTSRLYRPLKRQITARVDADVLEWLKSQGKGYQVRMNAILRREMLASLKARKRA